MWKRILIDAITDKKWVCVSEVSSIVKWGAPADEAETSIFQLQKDLVRDTVWLG